MTYRAQIHVCILHSNVVEDIVPKQVCLYENGYWDGIMKNEKTSGCTPHPHIFVSHAMAHCPVNSRYTDGAFIFHTFCHPYRFDCTSLSLGQDPRTESWGVAYVPCIPTHKNYTCSIRSGESLESFHIVLDKKFENRIRAITRVRNEGTYKLDIPMAR